MPIKLTTPVTHGEAAAPTTKAIIQKMADAYKASMKSAGDADISARFPGRINKNQASCAWISMNEIKQLIADNNNADGIRIYFGQHIAQSVPAGLNNYEGLLSLILVATKEKVNPANPTALTSEDQLVESSDPGSAGSVSITGPFTGQGADKLPICNPDCPPAASGMMKINI